MKYNLKNFPTEYPYPCPNVVKWKEGFEKELREKLITPLSETVHHEQLLRKLIKEILGE